MEARHGTLCARFVHCSRFPHTFVQSMRTCLPTMSRVVPFALPLVLVLVGCERTADTAAATANPAATQAITAPIAPLVLQDVIETTPSYIVGISYPQVASKYPPLAQAVQTYAESTRAQLMQAVTGLKGQKPEMPYDLSLSFTQVVETPRVVAVAAEGSSFTGGEHGTPLVERFVWLPQMQQMLAAEQLIPDAANRGPISAIVREQLMTALSQQLDDEGVEVDKRAQLLRSGSARIDAGTTPEPKHFSKFEPVMNADGSIRALRFVFPPEQVGTYDDGTRSADVPAKVLLPLIAPVYRPLFRAG